MSISDKLSDLNWQRNQHWKNTICQLKAPSNIHFDGDVYSGLDAYTIPTGKIEMLHSVFCAYFLGLYGLLNH
jgi:cytoplasmic iron level regulating protein YaaA (DUF328/UPF0246 family)